jgi:hypothetical protein
MKKALITELEYKVLKHFRMNESNKSDIDEIVDYEVESFEDEHILTIPHIEFVKKVHSAVTKAIKIKHYLPNTSKFEEFVENEISIYIKG